MKLFKSHLSLIVLFFFGLIACQKDSQSTQPEDELQLLYTKGQPSNDCFNFKTSSNGINLGCACLPTPLDCAPEAVLLCNFGASAATPVTLGNYTGYMTSIATGLEQSGNPPTGNGALHISLTHYFVTEDGQHAFWTEDQAVCAPGSNPYTCIVNDVLDIIGGCGDFEGAEGKLHTHGTLAFNGGAELCPIFYLGGDQDYVPTGNLTVDWHGRICTPGSEAD